jgi:hypothetical protein
MKNEFFRVFQVFDIEEVQKHLLILGDLKADCANCRALGIDGYTATHCPECKTEFKYLTSRRLEMHPGERFQLARRVHEQRPGYVFIDYSDYMHLLGKKKARDFFG